MRRILISVLSRPFGEFKQSVLNSDETTKQAFIGVLDSGGSYIECLQAFLELLQIAHIRVDACFID